MFCLSWAWAHTLKFDVYPFIREKVEKIEMWDHCWQPRLKFRPLSTLNVGFRLCSFFFKIIYLKELQKKGDKKIETEKERERVCVFHLWFIPTKTGQNQAKARSQEFFPVS